VAHNDELATRIARAAIVTSFPFLFTGRTGIGELFPGSVGRAEQATRAVRAAVAAQFTPARGAVGALQVPILEEIAGDAILGSLARGGPLPFLLRRLRGRR